MVSASAKRLSDVADADFWPKAAVESKRAERGPVFHVLFVCTGNVSRSAMATQLLRRRIQDWAGPWPRLVAVDSAGTGAVVGADLNPESADQLDRLGLTYSPGSHSGKQITPALLRQADLVLVMTSRHRKQLLHLRPKARAKVYTLAEFAKIAGPDPDWNAALVAANQLDLDDLAPEDNPARPLREQVKRLDGARPLVHHGVDKHGLDIVDPFRQGNEVYEEVADQISAALDAIFPPTLS